MKKKIKYTNEPMGNLRVIEDFLPSPDQLVLKEDNIKVTISFKKSSIEFFKKQAKKHHTSYQRMIRQVIDLYVALSKERLKDHSLLPNLAISQNNKFSTG